MRLVFDKRRSIDLQNTLRKLNSQKRKPRPCRPRRAASGRKSPLPACERFHSLGGSSLVFTTGARVA